MPRLYSKKEIIPNLERKSKWHGIGVRPIYTDIKFYQYTSKCSAHQAFYFLYRTFCILSLSVFLFLDITPHHKKNNPVNHVTYISSEICQVILHMKLSVGVIDVCMYFMIYFHIVLKRLEYLTKHTKLRLLYFNFVKSVEIWSRKNYTT